MKRRFFLQKTGVALGSAAFTPAFLANLNLDTPITKASGELSSWREIREAFELDHHHIQMAQMLLASHPKPVRDAIARYQKALDVDPATTWEDHWIEYRQGVYDAAEKYMGAQPGEVGLTGSTTEGMALLMNGFRLSPGDEVLSTTHDHYITDMSVDYAAKKRGATVRRIDEFADPATVTVEEVVSNITGAVRPRTRLVVVTWVQSCTGVKLPIRAIADGIADINRSRSANDRVYLMVDGVHGFGNQADSVASLGCDFFAAGTHKWIFGPRGSGVVYGRKDAWQMMEATIPTFRMHPYMTWMDQNPEGEETFADRLTPGGFHSFAYRWALKEAFEFQMDIGRDHVHARTTQLNTRLKEGLSGLKHLKLHTPMDPALSAGINCFEIGDASAMDLVEDFHSRGVIASASPYAISYARLTPCIINTEDEVDRCIEIVGKMKAR